MIRLRKWWLLGAAVVVATIGGLANASRAFAIPASCTTEEHVAGGNSLDGTDGNPTGSSWKRAFGSEINFVVKDRNTNSACVDTTLQGAELQQAGTFAKVRFVDSNDNVVSSSVSMGYYELNTPSGSHDHGLFAIWIKPGGGETDFQMGLAAQGASGFGTGKTCTARVWRDRASGSNWVWVPEINCGGNWEDPMGPNGTGVVSQYGRGLAIGLTSRFGGTATGMSDTITNARFFSTTGAWDPYNAIACYANTSSNWKLVKTGAPGWDVDKQAPNSGC